MPEREFAGIVALPTMITSQFCLTHQQSVAACLLPDLTLHHHSCLPNSQSGCLRPGLMWPVAFFRIFHPSDGPYRLLVCWIDVRVYLLDEYVGFVGNIVAIAC